MIYLAKGVKCTSSFTIVDNFYNELVNSQLCGVVTFKYPLSIGKFR